jgi:hypothetical protein
MRTLREMADRSDRREGKPITTVGSKARASDWLLTREFHFGQEMPGFTRATALHSQAGDTTAVLTLCRERVNPHRNRDPNTGARGEPENPSRTRANLESEVQLFETTFWFAPGGVFSGGAALLPLPQNHHLPCSPENKAVEAERPDRSLDALRCRPTWVTPPQSLLPIGLADRPTNTHEERGRGILEDDLD